MPPLRRALRRQLRRIRRFLNMSINKVPGKELENRMKRFTSAMDAANSEWRVCVIAGGMSMYYLTGTIADGALIIEREKESALWVRRNYERSVLESEFHDIRPMSSFRDVRSTLGELPDTVYLDMSEATLEWYGFFNKYMQFEKALPIDNLMLRVRAVKSPYEIEIMSRAGRIYDGLLRNDLPPLLREGVSEAELGAELYSLFIKSGYHGVSRFSMKNADVVMGHLGFAESPLYPSVFNGASGLTGLCPAAPVLGSREVKLKSGDLIYVDLGFGIDGYNIDKTVVYSYGAPQSPEVEAAHNHCLDIEKFIASMLCAGERPSDIYEKAMDTVKSEYRSSFMGTRGRTVPFLGHGVGLYINEWPVIAKGFTEPLECGMTMAVEPKIGIDGAGMVGSENTYLITESGAVSLTGEVREIVYCNT